MDADARIGSTLGNRYRIVGTIDEGVMGAVYEAVQLPLRRRVVVKVLRSPIADDARFRREASLAASLEHPNIVKILDFGVDGEEPFLVMDRLDGESLSEVLGREGAMMSEHLRIIAMQVLSAIEFAHGRGVIHCDIKPDNIFLTRSIEVLDLVKVLNFGIAGIAGIARERLAEGDEDPRMTANGQVLGTPASMSEDQAGREAGEEPDGARSDLFALGVVMYEALSARMPVCGSNYQELMSAIVHETPQPLAELAPEVSPGLVAVIERAIAKDPNARFQNAAEMRSALAAVGWTEMVQSRRPFVTWSIATLIGLVFVLQLVVGFSVPPQLVRMGALLPAKVADGELWRLLSCTLLHGGVMHVAFNTYLLVVLGSFLERVIGGPRLVTLYVGAALAGSLGSALFLGERFSVGASGAVWGLLGAHAVLAFFSGDLIPKQSIPGARRAALINLGLNIANSLNPHVDMAAHFGGGLAGAALFALVLRRGLPPLSDPSSMHKVKAPRPILLTSALGGSLLIASIVVAVVKGDPFALGHPPVLTRIEIPKLGVEFDAPTGLERSFVGERELVFGSPLGDAMLLSVLSSEVPPLDAETFEREFAELIEAVGQPVNDTRPDTVERFADGGDPGIRVIVRFPNELILERAFILRPGLLIRVDAFRWPDLAAAPAGIAERLVRTARPIGGVPDAG